MSVKEHMTSMANSIRSISGLSSKMNLSTIASNVSKCKEQIDIEGQLMYNLLLKLLGKLGITSIDADIETTGISSDLMMGKEMIDDSGNKVVGSMIDDSENIIKLLNRTISEYTNSTTTSIGNRTFANCSSLTSVDFPACTYIGSGAFFNCTSLTSVDFPACTSIGTSNAFRTCTSLTYVSFPACTDIGDFTFNSCTNLVSVSFPACTNIGSRAFYKCTSLTSVNFPVCISIGVYAFSSCTRLTTANFPACTDIASYAFYNCSGMTSLTLGASTVCTLGNTTAFTNTPMSKSTYTGTFGSIYVPASLVDAYKSATNWATYSSRITSMG